MKPDTHMQITDTLHEYVGALHIHSNFSDGLRPIPEIAEIAGKCGIEFLLFADHMTLKPLNRGLEKWYGSTLAVIGYEHNDKDNKNHYLAFGVDKVLPVDLPAQDYVKQIRDAGGIGFIAHPDEKRNAMQGYPPYPWTAWDSKGYDGIEIWNHSSEWMEQLNHLNKYYMVLHPLKMLKGPERETLDRWDELNKTSVMPGIGGLDAHAYPYQLGPITIYIFRYKVLFKGIRTHILINEPLSEDVKKSKKTILKALKSARCFISNHRWGNARGFRFEALTRGRTRFMGDTIKGKKAEFIVSAPEAGKITLLCNGRLVASAEGTSLTFNATETGAYRAEVRKKEKPWIYSNHIRLLN